MDEDIVRLPKWELWYAWHPVRVGVTTEATWPTLNGAVQGQVTLYHWAWFTLIARQKVRRADLLGNWWIYRYALAHKAVTQ